MAACTSAICIRQTSCNVWQFFCLFTNRKNVCATTNCTAAHEKIVSQRFLFQAYLLSNGKTTYVGLRCMSIKQKTLQSTLDLPSLCILGACKSNVLFSNNIRCTVRQLKFPLTQFHLKCKSACSKKAARISHLHAPLSAYNILNY